MRAVFASIFIAALATCSVAFADWDSFCGPGNVPPWATRPDLPECEGEGKAWDIDCVLARFDEWDECLEHHLGVACGEELFCRQLHDQRVNLAYRDHRDEQSANTGVYLGELGAAAAQYRVDGDFAAYQANVLASQLAYEAATETTWASLKAELEQHARDQATCLAGVSLGFADGLRGCDQAFDDTICECWE